MPDDKERTSRGWVSAECGVAVHRISVGKDIENAAEATWHGQGLVISRPMDSISNTSCTVSVGTFRQTQKASLRTPQRLGLTNEQTVHSNNLQEIFRALSRLA